MFKGTVIAQFIGVLGSLYVANLYAPEYYGYYGVFFSFVNILHIAGTFKLNFAVVTEKSDKKAENLLNTLFIINVLMTLLFLLFFTVFKNFFLERKIPYFLLILASTGTFFFTISKLFESYATRKATFKPIANAKIITTATTVLFQFILWYQTKEKGLLFGFILAIILVSLYLYKKVDFHFKKPNFILFKNTLRSYRNLLSFGFPSALVNTIATNIISILLVAYFSAEAVGNYTLSMKIVSIPMFLISASVSQVFFQKASKMFHNQKDKLFDLTKKIAFYNIIFMLLAVLIINTIGVYFLNLFFDKDWANLSKYIYFLSIFMVGQATFAPISSIIIVTNKMHIGLIFNIMLLCINLISIYIGNLYQDIFLTIKLLSIFGGLSYIILLIYFLSLLKSYKNA